MGENLYIDSDGKTKVCNVKEIADADAIQKTLYIKNKYTISNN